MIDHYALLSGQFDFLLQLYARLNPSRNLHLLPNFAYSVPLAMYLKKDSQDAKPTADDLLQDALIMFPGFLTRLLKHISLGGINNLDKSVLFGREVRRYVIVLTMFSSPDNVHFVLTPCGHSFF
ncbi:hypothetical protein PHET_11345, partial [Paragonimus heterotremus]